MKIGVRGYRYYSKMLFVEARNYSIWISLAPRQSPGTVKEEN